jgi:hypothetical protein
MGATILSQLVRNLAKIGYIRWSGIIREGQRDHCHFNGREERYYFRSVEVLVDDFLRDIDQAREGLNP